MAVPMAFVKEELDQLKKEGRFTHIRTLESPQGAWVIIEGKRRLNLCSNNYLGFCNDPRLCAGVKEAVDRYGVGPGAVRTIAGTMRIHKELEERWRPSRSQAAIVVSSASRRTDRHSPVVGKGRPVFSDGSTTPPSSTPAASPGPPSSRAATTTWKIKARLPGSMPPPRSTRHLRRSLFHGWRRGSLAAIVDLLAERYGAMTAVDVPTAKSPGEIGAGHRGHFHLHGRVDLEIGTSQGLWRHGGFVTARAEVVEFLRQKARLTSSPAPSPSPTAASLAAVAILEQSDEPVRKLWENGLLQGS